MTEYVYKITRVNEIFKYHAVVHTPEGKTIDQYGREDRGYGEERISADTLWGMRWAVRKAIRLHQRRRHEGNPVMETGVISTKYKNLISRPRRTK